MPAAPISKEQIREIHHQPGESGRKTRSTSQRFSLRRGFAPLVLILAAATAMTMGEPASAADPWSEIAEFQALDGASDSYFGESIAVDGLWAIVGAPFDEEAGTDAGAAYLFFADGNGDWTEHLKLIGPDTSAQDRFGLSVAIDYPWALVGAPLEDELGEDAGAVYAWYCDADTGWYYAGKLTEPGGGVKNEFGASIDVYDHTMIVGAPKSTWSNDGRGAFYIYEYTYPEWNVVYSYRFTSGHERTAGYSVAIGAEQAVVGVPDDGSIGGGAGGVWVVARNEIGFWELAQKLHHYGAQNSDRFGTSVALDQDLLIVGAPYVDDVDSDAGGAYIYHYGYNSFYQEYRWKQIAELLPPDGYFQDYFGRDVALDNGYALIGATGDDDNGARSGSAYFYKLEGANWNFKQKVIASDGDVADGFGSAVAMNHAADALIGASFDEDRGIASGTVYQYTCTDPVLIVLSEPIYAGYSFALDAFYLTPETVSFLAYGLDGRGATYVDPLNITVDMWYPRRAGPKKFTDTTGYVGWELPVPDRFSSFPVWLQVVQPNNKTNVVANYLR